MIYTCKHFKIQELVPKEVYEARKELAWELMDINLLVTLDALRDCYGPMVVNDWAFGGEREWSGLRTSKSPYGAEYSQHRFGRAADIIFHNHTAEEVRQDILADPRRFPMIMSVELGTSWLHIDTRNCRRVKTYYP